MANKKLFAGITAAVAVLGVLAATGINNSELIFTKAADAEYTLSVTASDIKGLNSVPYVTTALGNQVKVAGSDLTIDTTINLVNGSLYVVDPLNGIKSLTVDVADESALPTLHYGWTSGEYAAETITLEDDVAADLTALTPNYFKLEGTANIVSIEATYSCTPGVEPETLDLTNMKVYFNNPGWSKVYAYVWKNGSSALKAWPGTEITKDPNAHIGTLYSFTYNVEQYDRIIFNNGSGAQTADLISPRTLEEDCYDFKLSTWIDEKDAKDESMNVDYYLVGSMNDWKYNEEYKLTDLPSSDTSIKRQVYIQLTFKANDEWKIHDSQDVWHSYVENAGALKDGLISVPGNIKVNTAGTYNIYFKIYQDNGTSMYVEAVK